MAGPPSSSVLLCPLYRCASMNPQRSGGGGGEGELKDSTKETGEESTDEVSRIFGLCVYSTLAASHEPNTKIFKSL
jgi:hypothetical protein